MSAPLPPTTPNAALADIRAAASTIRRDGNPGEQLLAARALVIAVEWLDGWLSAGGVRPDPWSTAPAVPDPVTSSPDPRVAAAAQDVRAARQAVRDAQLSGRAAMAALSTATRTLAEARDAYEDLLR